MAYLGSWNWDIQDNRLIVDEDIAQLYSMDAEEVAAGQPIEAFLNSVHEADRERIRQEFEKSVEKTGEFEAEYRIRDGNGDTKWVVSRADVEYGENGEPLRMHGAIADITTHKRSEQRAQLLDTVSRELQPLTDPDEIMATTAWVLGEHLGADRCAYAEVMSDEDHFVITGDYTPGDTESIVGRWAFSNFGDDCIRLMRQNSTYVVDDVDADERVTEADRPAYEQTQIEAVICVPLHKDGQFVSAMAVHQRTPRNWQPHEVELVKFVVQRCWESLERARTMRDLRDHKQQLEQQNKRLESFAGMLAHELRNPLQIAQMYIQTAKTGDKAAFDEIATAHNRMEEMIDILLVLARGSDSAINPELVNLRAAATDVWSDLSAPSDRLHVETDLVLKVEPNHLHHVLENLFQNALKHGDSDVSIQVGGLSDGFYVADTGASIPEDERERVFKPGYTTDPNGIGLGLTFIQQLTEAYGWKCTVTESADGGAQFEFRDVDLVRGE